jgi:uncharacterized membrane protein (DUF4010 family)
MTTELLPAWRERTSRIVWIASWTELTALLAICLSIFVVVPLLPGTNFYGLGKFLLACLVVVSLTSFFTMQLAFFAYGKARAFGLPLTIGTLLFSLLLLGISE